MKILDVVATLGEYPERRIGRVQLATIVKALDNDQVLVELADLNGFACATLPEMRFLTAESAASVVD